MVQKFWKVKIEFDNENTNTYEGCISETFYTEDEAIQFYNSIMSKYKDKRKEDEINFWDKNNILTEDNIYISGGISHGIIDHC